MESSHDIIFLCSYIPEFHYQYISPSVEKILGYSCNEVYENPELRHKILHPEDISSLAKEIQTDRTTIRKIIRYIHKNNKIVWLDTKYSITRDESGKTIKMLGLADDITNVYKQEFQSVQYNLQLNELLNSIHGVAKISLQEERFIYVNRKLCQITQLNEKELLEKRIKDVFPDLKLFYKKENLSKITLFTTTKGEKKHINVFYSTVTDVNDNQAFFICLFEDITRDKEYENEILNQKRKLESIFNTSGHILWTVSENMKVTSFNENFFSSSSALAKPSHLIDSGLNTININNPNYELWIKKYTEAFSGEPQHFEILNYDKNNNEVWSEVFLSPIRDSSGKISEVSGIAHNITEIKKNQQQISRSLKEKEVLLSEIHHRVKNNLQVIISILNLQSTTIQDKITKNYLIECQERIRSMSYIHESLYRNKDFSNIIFSDYVKSISQNLLSSYSTTKRKIEIFYELEHVSLNLDLSIPCGLILNELVSNAIKYAFIGKKKGKIYISLTKKEAHVLFKISDDGIGFPDEIDFKNTETLGLMLVTTLVEQLNGTIDLTTKSGTEFLITFTNRNL